MEMHAMTTSLLRSPAPCFAHAREVRTPFRHSLLRDALPAAQARALAALPFAPPAIGNTNGRRETNNSTRVFFGAENQRAHRVCAELAATFQDSANAQALALATGAPLDGSYLRIEYCLDTDGFWLERHTDIGAKLFTLLVYLSDVSAAEGWGTDIYADDGAHLGAASGAFNKGLVFVPGSDTWHGFQRRNIAGVRRSIIVNYVKNEWRARHELAFPDRPIAF
jgi:hypothetical protein